MPTAPRDVALPARGEARLDFVIRSGFAIAGQVRGVDGRPAAGALVFATREVEPALSGQARTDGDGRYRIEGLGAAKYSVNPPRYWAFCAPSDGSVDTSAGRAAVL